MSASNEPVISFEGVRLGFGEGDVLRGVSFHVAPGETKVLIGESGAGKTLALKLAAGLLKPTAGLVRVLGSEISGMSETALLDFRRQIGFVFQEGALFDSMSVRDNVAYRLSEEAVDPSEIEERVRQALHFVELDNTEALLPGDLSGGMRRRVSIARAVISNPPIVLFDSPTAGLDPVTSQTIIALLLRLRDVQGITSVLVTQRMQDAFGLANYRFDAKTNSIEKLPNEPPNGQNGAANDGANGKPLTNFVVLRDGQVYYQGSPEEVLASPDPYLKRFLI